MSKKRGGGRKRKEKMKEAGRRGRGREEKVPPPSSQLSFLLFPVSAVSHRSFEKAPSSSCMSWLSVVRDQSESLLTCSFIWHYTLIRNLC